MYNIVIYSTENGKSKLEVLLENETIWLNQKQIAELYNKSKSTISEHIKNIFEEEELERDSVVRKFRTTASDGKNYDVEYYNLEMIIVNRDVLEDRGKISKKEADQKAKSEYEKYSKLRRIQKEKEAEREHFKSLESIAKKGKK